MLKQSDQSISQYVNETLSPRLSKTLAKGGAGSVSVPQMPAASNLLTADYVARQKQAVGRTQKRVNAYGILNNHGPYLEKLGKAK